MSLSPLTKANIISDKVHLPQEFQYIVERLLEFAKEVDERQSPITSNKSDVCGSCKIEIFYNLAGASYMSGIWIKIAFSNIDIWLFSPFIKSLKLKIICDKPLKGFYLRKYGMPSTFYKRPAYIFDCGTYLSVPNLMTGICEKVKELCDKDYS